IGKKRIGRRRWEIRRRGPIQRGEKFFLKRRQRAKPQGFESRDRGDARPAAVARAGPSESGDRSALDGTAGGYASTQAPIRKFRRRRPGPRTERAKIVSRQIGATGYRRVGPAFLDRCAAISRTADETGSRREGRKLRAQRRSGRA